MTVVEITSFTDMKEDKVKKLKVEVAGGFLSQFKGFS